ncbi:invertebrate-type lysozyme 3-like [Lycorma delicatula]|uniref:invertebrate-type lysozyme 3-like n=1 Tax=Lycorma delicatula TaxID=130591 RepID=UPI003F51576F
MRCFLALIFIFGFLTERFVSGQISYVEPVTDICLGCICEAISNCNKSLTCEGDVCGIFRITWAYWADAGKPILLNDDPNSPGAYSRCVNDPVCAGNAVTNYMNRFAQDCNGDGRIECGDYAKIHRLGGYGCRGPLDAIYEQRFYNCQKQVAQFSQPTVG